MSAPRTRTRRRRSPGSSGARVLVALGAALWVSSACGRTSRTAEVRVPVDTLLAPADTVPIHLPEGLVAHPEILQVTAAVEGLSGWVVLDGMRKRLGLLSPNGDLERVVGREGDGPGELRHPVAVALLGTRVVVAERGGRLVFFRPDGTPGDLAQVRDPTCAVSQVRAALSGADSLALLETCVRRSGRFSARVERVGADGGHRLLAEWAYDDAAAGAIDPMRFPVLGRVGEGLALGVAPDPCLRILDERGVTTRRLCYPDLPRRPLPDSARVAFRRLRERLRSRGVAFGVSAPPLYLPAFRALLGGGATWGFLSVPPGGGDAIDRVEGRRLHRIVVPEGARAFLGRRSILLVGEDLEGTSFTVLTLPGGDVRGARAPGAPRRSSGGGGRP